TQSADADRAQARTVAQDGDVDADLPRRVPDRRAGGDGDGTAVDGQGDGHTSSGQCFITDRIGFSATCPSPQIDVSAIASPSSGSSASSFRSACPDCTRSSNSTAFCEPRRQGTHLPHDSLRKKRTTFVARASMSVPSATTTTAPEPSIEPALAKAAKSSG